MQDLNFTNLKMESMALISSQNLKFLFFNIFQLVHTLSSIYDTLEFFSSPAYTFQEEEVERNVHWKLRVRDRQNQRLVISGDAILQETMAMKKCIKKERENVYICN